MCFVRAGHWQTAGASAGIFLPGPTFFRLTRDGARSHGQRSSTCSSEQRRRPPPGGARQCRLPGPTRRSEVVWCPGFPKPWRPTLTAAENHYSGKIQSTPETLSLREASGCPRGPLGEAACVRPLGGTEGQLAMEPSWPGSARGTVQGQGDPGTAPTAARLPGGIRGATACRPAGSGPGTAPWPGGGSATQATSGEAFRPGAD